MADTKEYTIPIGVPFTVPQKGGRNVSDKVVLLNSSSRILNPSKRKGASQNVIYPNEAVGLELAYELGFVDDLPNDIKAGDYFTVKLSDNYDPTGISPIQVLTDKISLANNLGVIAEATYDPTNKTIKYTFTDYVDTFKVLSGTTSIGGYVDRSVITTSKKGEVFGYTIGDSSLGMTYKTEPIDIDYREKEAHQVANQGTLPFQTPPNLKGFPSVGSLVVSSDINKNTFRQIIYVNPLEGNQQTTTNTTLTFSNRGNQNSITNAAGANIKIYKVPTASRKYMPYSYAYNQKTFDEGLKSGEVQDVSEKFEIDTVPRTVESSLDKFTINFGTVAPEDSYVIVVDGKFINLDETNDNPQYLSQVFYDFDDIKISEDQYGLQLPDVESITRNNAVNYTPSSASGDGESGITIVNNKGIDIFAQKEWSNVSDAKGKEIILKLFANGEAKESVTLNGETDSYTSMEGEYYPWRAGFWNLPPYDENGDLIKYSVKEYSNKDGVEVEGLDGFKTTYAPESLTAETFSKFITVTNEKEEEKVTIVAEKEWQKDGQKTESNAKPSEDAPDVYFQLMKGESKVEVPEGQSNPIQYSGKTVSWENLPKVDTDGEEIQYTVKEVGEDGKDWQASGYTVSEPTVQEAVADNPDTEEDETQPKTFTFINNYQTTSVKVTKEWANVPEGTTKPDVYFQLMKGEELVGDPKQLPTDSTEVVEWTKLPKVELDSEGNGVEITYTVKEVDEDGKDWQAPGYTVSEPTVQAAVADDPATEEDETQPKTFTFINNYETTSVKVTKEWTNVPEDETKPDVYFQLMKGEELVGDPKQLPTDSTEVEWTNLPKVDTDGNEIQYTVKEVGEEGNDWKADNYTSGKVTAVEGSRNEFTVENIYEPKPGEAKITATKVLTGREIADGEFEFVLTETTEGVEAPHTETVTNVGGNITFSPIRYDKAGTYTYTITETKGELPGITYDETAVNVTVVVTDKEGTLETAVTYENEDSQFENAYTATPGEANITATKALTGRELADGEFEFVLTETTEGVETPHTEPVTNVGGNITFSPIRYDKVGTYTYTITETKGELPGITYDETAVNVTVVVTDKEGKLETAVTYENEDSQFENAYTATPGEATITATKALTGRELADGEFEFVLTETTEGVEKGHTETVANVGGNITFAPISYEKAGTYTYTITETKGELPGITYDETPVNVTVVVTDNNGTLETTVTYDNEDSQFENQYTPTPGEANITATKVLTGRELADGEFEFVLTETTEGVEKPHTETVKNVGGNITFKPISYEKEGTYTYTITETKGELPGVTYDETPVNVTVVVTDKEGKLEAAVRYEKEDSQFENSYKPADGALVLEVSKVLTGREIKDGEFSFELINAEGQVIHTVSNKAGKVIFPAITLSKTGEFTYTIKEVQGSDSTVKYDDSTISATFQVSDQEGKLIASEVVYSPDAEFENIVEEITTTEESTSTTITEISTTTTEEPTTTTEAPKPDLYDVSIKKVDQYGQAVEGVTFELYQVTQTTVEATSDSSAVPDEPISVDTSIIDKEIEALRAQIVELENQRAILEAEHETAIQSESSESFDSEHLITIESLKTQIATLEEQLEEKLAEKSALMINTTAEEFDESGLMKVSDLVEEVKVGTYITDKSGLIQVSGLDEGEYYFVETAAPAGYEFTNKPYYFNLPNDQSLLITIENCNNNTTSVEDTTTTVSTTTVENTTTTLSTTVEDRPTTLSTTTVEDRPTTASTTTVEDRPTTVSTTTVEDRPTTVSTTTVEDTTTSESTTTVEYFTTAEDTTTTEETPVPSGVTSVSGGTPGDNISTPNQQQDQNNHLPHTGESIMSQIVLSTIGVGLLTGGFLVLRSKFGYKS